MLDRAARVGCGLDHCRSNCGGSWSDASDSGRSSAHKVVNGRAALSSYLGAVPQVIGHGPLLLLLPAAPRAAVGRSRWAAVLSTLVLLPIALPRSAHLVTVWLVMGVGGAAVASGL